MQPVVQSRSSDSMQTGDSKFSSSYVCLERVVNCKSNCAHNGASLVPYDKHMLRLMRPPPRRAGQEEWKRGKVVTVH